MSVIKDKNNENVVLNACEEEKDDNDNGNIENNYITPEMVLRLPTITDSKSFKKADVSSFIILIMFAISFIFYNCENS